MPPLTVVSLTVFAQDSCNEQALYITLSGASCISLHVMAQNAGLWELKLWLEMSSSCCAPVWIQYHHAIFISN